MATFKSSGHSSLMAGILGTSHASKAMLYFQMKIFNYWLTAALVLFSMFGAANAQGSIFEGPILSSRRLQNFTQEPGASPPSIAGIFTNTFGQSCRAKYLKILDATDSFDALGSSAATTVMTLIPAMITFAAIPMASIRSLKFINTQMAIFTSALTLGMSIETRKTLRKRHQKTVKELLGDKSMEKFNGTIKDLQNMYNQPGCLEDLWKSLEKPRPRVIYVYFIVSCYSAFQVILFGTLVRALPKIENILFIWACPEKSGTIFNAWLGITAMLAAIFRTLSVSSLSGRNDEIIYISSLPSNYTSVHCPVCSAMAQDPWPDNRLSFSQRTRRAFSLKFHYIFKGNLINSFRPYFISQPMVVVIRNSRPKKIRDTLLLSLHGFVQAISIVLLTFMFASMWGGSVMWTTLFVAAFMSIIWASRTASLLVGEYLERQTGMTVISSHSKDERTAILRVLKAMPDALVESKFSGFLYYDGHNLNSRCEDASHEGSELRYSRPMETIAVSSGLLSGVLIGLLVGMGVFVSFYIATLPYNASFIPHPRDWIDFPVAIVVSTLIAAAFWADFAFQRSGLLIWGDCYKMVKKFTAEHPKSDVEAGGTQQVDTSHVRTEKDIDEVDPQVTDVSS